MSTNPYGDTDGERNGMSILTTEVVIQIFIHMRDGTMSRSELATKYGVHKNTIRSIAHRHSWRKATEPYIKKKQPAG